MKNDAGSTRRSFRALIVVVALAAFVGLFSGPGTARAEGDGVDCLRQPCYHDCFNGCADAQDSCISASNTALQQCLAVAGANPDKISACHKDDAARKTACTSSYDSCVHNCFVNCQGECDPGQECVNGECVPEPGTIFLAVSGLGVAGLYLRRWRPFARPR